jgi:hypothetical protein
MSRAEVLRSHATHRERQFLHYLRGGDWRTYRALPVPVGDGLMRSLQERGWIEIADDRVRLTVRGHAALCAKVPLSRQEKRQLERRLFESAESCP